MTPPPANIAILGGGTAGWMAACLMARAWPHAVITVVESPDIGIVGVGEGSTPQLKALFDTLGIAEAEWMTAADATYKAGIAFHGWGAGDGSSYFHPFASQIDVHSQGAFFASTRARRLGADVPAHPDRFFLNARLAQAGRAPIASPNFPFRIGYGYHFDAHKVGGVLRDHALGRGVMHLPRRVVDIAVADGAVSHLTLDGGDTLHAELFVDASGFRSVIAQGALGVPFRSFAGNLFTDRAVVMPTPPGPNPAVFTRATAMTAGWAWDIPLTTRTGNGYVYSSRHLSADAAETELRTHLGLLDADVPARHLTMKVGRVETSWTANCLAIGLAQGFIEPLEATALHIVQATVEGFIAAHAHADRSGFNAAIARRYDGIRDYIVAHYRLNRRSGNFWRENAANDDLSDDLKAILTAWFTGDDVATVIVARDLGGYYAPMSWEVLLAGYGTFPDAARLRPSPAVADVEGVDALLDGCLLNFPEHAAALRRRRLP